MSKRIRVKDLHADNVETQPRDMDWSEGYPDKWEYLEASDCSECGKVLMCQGHEQHGDIDNESECEGYVSNEGPMMNYFYPLGNDFARAWPNAEEATKAIANLPLCIIRLGDCNSEDEWGLALTGGGMDLSWQICEAYIRLGYLPPLHFCDLPAMSDMTLNAKNKMILAACRKSAQIASARSSNATRHLSNIRTILKKQSKPKE